MKHADFDTIMRKTIEKIQELSKLKGGEYAGDYDRLANFKRNADNLGVTPELVWAVYAGKHWDAVSQYVNDLQNGKTRERMEPIEGRLDDLILYCILMQGLIAERKQNAFDTKTALDAYGELTGTRIKVGTETFSSQQTPVSW